MSTINCNGTLIDLSSPKVMGILNITPDSFFDGGKYSNEEAIISQVEKMLTDGATFIDIGAYSSRPGAKHISEEEELNRIVPVIQLLVKEFPNIIISIDTFRSIVAEQCIKHGACIINDISAGSLDTEMFSTIAKLQVPYIIMHMQGSPQNMQNNPTYTNITQEVLYYFSTKISELRALGVNDIIIDVGFGFGKTIDHNYELLKNLPLFKNLEVPMLVGISRKSMLNKPLNISAEEALNATTSANTIALLNGTNILRVHDVKEATQAIKIVELLNN
ncbi:dihydropteroate synthase [Lutibacter agarilyticus]|uniref:Dihydropteroate synthase n=1 Tax=Lutibacter agarilyticus TaxID=1109740 RepID=A0A238WK18_9FLAO|nr:dihydropteroate synthase [Lutibacter agarilyticus]SNR46681.1 dihydropteroate synthase [Lutibacter agarilyticus]